MSMPLKVRASSIPLAAKCAASLTPPALRIEGDREAADLGTATHAVLTDRISGIGLTADLGTIAEIYEVDHAELSKLVAWGWQAWQQFAPYFPEPQVEREFSHGWLTGHVDVFARDAGQVRIADFKTGRLDPDAEAQVKAYAWLALQEYPECSSAYTAIIRVRDHLAYGKVYGREELEEWSDHLEQRLEEEQEVYRPGDHCRHCPRAHECPALREVLGAAACSLLAVVDMEGVGQQEKAALYQEAKLLQKTVDQVLSLLKTDVATHGAIPLDNGRELAIVPQEQRKIDFSCGEEILRECLGERLGEALTVGKGKAEEIVRSNAGRGQKGKAVVEMMDRLSAAGAVTVHMVERLEVRRNDANSIPAIGTSAGERAD